MIYYRQQKIRQWCFKVEKKNNKVNKLYGRRALKMVCSQRLEQLSNLDFELPFSFKKLKPILNLSRI